MLPGDRTPLGGLTLTPSEISEERTAFHEADGFHWTETTWFGLAIPERKIHGTYYVWHRPQLGLTSGGIAFWDGQGEELHDCLYSSWDPYLPFPSDGDLFDHTLANGTSIGTIEPRRSYRLGFEGDGCELDAVWEGFIPIQGFDLTNTELADGGQGHYEQAGHVTGTVKIGGDSYEIDARLLRDHSWGPRGHDLRFNIGFDHAYPSDDHGFTLCVRCDEPERADDGTISVSGDTLLLGWYLRDGEVSKLTEVRRWVELGDDGCPVRFVTDGRDELGRELHVEGRRESKLNWPGPTRSYWAGVTFEVDGQTAWGETQSGNMNPQMFRADQRRRFA
jgi:hypothetical protein